MKKIELLAPVGRMNSVYAAIQSGADAIYLGGKSFGARAFADNFTVDEIKSIVEYAHVYHVRVYVTVNTLLFEDEIESCLEYIQALYNVQVDALIIQDLGLLYLVRNRFSDFEVHASTQMHVYNQNALQFLHRQGVKRAVLARECSLDQIRSFASVPIEKEVFIHGAICIAFSGQCLFSSIQFARSGNRGACAQNCRMVYSLVSDHEELVKQTYLMSPKDLNTLDYMHELKAAGIHSFKIEGRMKSDAYVAYVTKLYRYVMDNDKKISEDELNKLKVLYSREYTHGHLVKDGSLLNQAQANHVGIPLGVVTNVNKDKIFVRLVCDLHQHDGIRFVRKDGYGFQVERIYKDGLLVNHANKNDQIALDRRGATIQVGTKLVKTKDSLLEAQLEQDFKKIQRREKVNMHVTLRVGQPIVLQLEDMYGNEVTVSSEVVVEKATNKAITIAIIESKMGKIKDTIYEYNQLVVDVEENVFVAVSQLNELRRIAFNQLGTMVLSSFKRYNNPFRLNPRKSIHPMLRLVVSVLKEYQLLACLPYEYLEIITENKALYTKYQHLNQVSYRQSHVVSEQEEAQMYGDIGGIQANKDLDYTLNVCNSYALEYLQHFHVNTVYLSLELSKQQITTLVCNYIERNKSCNIGLVVYGKVKVMSMKYCIVKHTLQLTNCQMCRNHMLYLKDKKQSQFYLFGDSTCNLQIYNAYAHDYLEDIEYYYKLGIRSFRIDFSDESEQKIHEINRKFQNYYRKFHFDAI